MNKAEVGSVRFFRRMITLVTLAVITILAISLIFVAGNLKKAKTDLDYYKGGGAAGSVMVDNTSVQDGEQNAYETLFPDMYVSRPEEFTRLFDKDRFFYLTFTGGPSLETSKILDQLAALDVKATFFVKGGDSPEGRQILKRIVDEGHTVGIYGYELSKDKVYESVEVYLEDFWKEYQLIYDATGVQPTVFKFQGGTTNSYNALIRQALCSEMVRRGFSYFDWNANSGDLVPGTDAETIAANAILTGGEKQRIFLQMHDCSGGGIAGAKALPKITEHFKEAGYEFRPITNDIMPMAFE